MKNKSALMLAFFCLLGYALSARRAVLIGNVSSSPAKTVETQYNKGTVFYTEFKRTFPIDKKGNFKLEFDITSLKKIYMIIGEQQTSFFIEPGDSILLKIDYKDFDKSLSYSGANSGKNRLLKAYEEKFVFGHEQEVFLQNAYRKAADFAGYCDSLLNAKLVFIDGFKDKPSAVFADDFKASLTYESAANKMEYAGMWAYLRHKRDTLPDVPANYYNFIKKLDLNNGALVDNEDYLRCVKEVVEHYGGDIDRTLGIQLTARDYASMAKIILKNNIIEMAYEASLAYNWLNYHKFNEAEEFYLAYLQNHSQSPYNTELQEYYNKVKKVAPGQMAPDINLTDDQGKPVSLGSFKGKVIYLDFWASWCGPCLREMPYSKKLRKEFEQKEVVFFYVSIDDDAKSWKEAIAKHEITGVHVNAPGWDHAVSKAYNISGVPGYFLIGKDGKIINNSPARPSDEEGVKKEIYAALEK